MHACVEHIFINSFQTLFCLAGSRATFFCISLLYSMFFSGSLLSTTYLELSAFTKKEALFYSFYLTILHILALCGRMFIVLNKSLFLRSQQKPSNLTLHIHLTILTSFLSSLIISSSTGQVLFLYGILLCT